MWLYIFRVGLHFDVRFGFGLINAGALVSAALNWSTVPEKYSCRVEASLWVWSPGSFEFYSCFVSEQNGILADNGNRVSEVIAWKITDFEKAFKYLLK